MDAGAPQAASRTASLDWLGGCIPDLPTPFEDHDRIDFAGVARLCERQIAAGARALVVGDAAGEGSTLSHAEHGALLCATVAIVRGRIPVIAGAGSNATAQAIALTRQAAASGAAAVLSVVPYYNRPTQDGIVAHFEAIATAAALPVILHDHPSRCARGLGDDAVVRLACLPQIVGLVDSTGDLARLSRLRSRLPAGFRLLSGDDATAPSFLAMGGDGAVSATANLCSVAARDRWMRLTAALAEDGTAAGLKYALGLLGLIAPHLRLPMVEPGDAAKAAIARALMAGVDDARARPRERRFDLD